MRRTGKYIALCMAMCLSLSVSIPVSAGSGPAAGGAAQDVQEDMQGIQSEIQEEIQEEIQDGAVESLSLEEVFPDPVFRGYVAAHVDTDGDGLLSAQEAEQVTGLSLSGMGIASLKGIRHFAGLQTLDCSDDQIGALDLAGMESLQSVTCTGNSVSLSVNEAGQVDLSEIPDMDLGRIRDVSQGTWVAEGILQLPGDLEEGKFTYTYSTTGEEEEQADVSGSMGVTVVLEGYQADENVLSENISSENETPGVSAEQEIKAVQEVYNEEVTGRRLEAGVAARPNTAVIKSCKILRDKSKVEVRVSIPKQVKSQDKYYYLFSSDPTSKKLPKKPLAKMAKKNALTFTVPLGDKGSSGYKLQSKFQVAVKVKGKYQAISKEKYIKNPEILASSTLPFTKGASKKGLQFGESLPDAISLGSGYCLFNINITELMQPGGLKYKYKGKTYDFNQARFQSWGSLFSQLQNAGMNLSVEFLLPWVDGQTDLIHPAARSRGAHNYYAWNISSPAARNRYEALFSCLAEWFNGKNGYGYINNYLIGNEVNAFDQWHYTGSSSLAENADLYADTYHAVYMAVKSQCKNARISICLDHSWNVDAPGKLHSSRSFLDRFASRLKRYSSPNFTIAYHAYPIPLTQADFWNNSAQRVKNSTSSPYITMKNMQYLTKYVKEKYGSKTRIMLTEQGFSSHGANGEKKQAAAIAYAFYKAEFNRMIDCIIFRSQADAQVEIDSDDLHMGLWTVGMGKKKAAYNVFKYMDTPKCERYTKPCRQYLGISKWTQLIPIYKASRFK